MHMAIRRPGYVGRSNRLGRPNPPTWPFRLLHHRINAILSAHVWPKRTHPSRSSYSACPAPTLCRTLWIGVALHLLGRGGHAGTSPRPRPLCLHDTDTSPSRRACNDEVSRCDNGRSPRAHRLYFCAAGRGRQRRGHRSAGRPVRAAGACDYDARLGGVCNGSAPTARREGWLCAAGHGHRCALLATAHDYTTATLDLSLVRRSTQVHLPAASPRGGPQACARLRAQ